MYTFIVKHFFKITGRSLFKIKTIGIENYPKSGGALLILNHNSILDAFLIMAAQPRVIRFVIFESFFKIRFLGKFLYSLKMIPIGSIKNKKELENFEALCAKRINEGEILCIFPEGELPRGGFINDFKKGFETIAKLTGVNIIPVNVDNAIGSPMTFKTGQNKSVRFKFRPKRTRITFNIGTPMPSNTTTFQVKQKVKELEADSFKYRLRKNDKILKYINSKNDHKYNPKISALIVKSIVQAIAFDKEERIFVALPKQKNLAEILKICAYQSKLYCINKDYKNPEEIREILINENITRFFCSKEIFNNLIEKNSISQFSKLKDIYIMDGYIDNVDSNEENQNVNIYECYGNGVFPIISMNTKDVKGKDLSGNRMFQRLNKKSTLGRLMPGVAVRVVDPNNFNSELQENQEGKLLIKGFGIADNIEDKSKIHNGWFISEETGFIDSSGFLTITKYN